MLNGLLGSQGAGPWAQEPFRQHFPPPGRRLGAGGGWWSVQPGPLLLYSDRSLYLWAPQCADARPLVGREVAGRV